jgi:hypothetical protein
MVLDRQGNPLTETKDRRDEVARCLDVIGWSWTKLGERVLLSQPTVFQVKNCKRPIADSDIRWLQDLADAHKALPRPVEQNDPSPVNGAPLVQAGAVLATADLNPATGNGASLHQEMPGTNLVQQLREEIAEQSTVALVANITSVYLSAVAGVGPDAMTDEQAKGARWALGELALQLGVLDAVQEQLRAYQAQAAVVPAAPRIGAIGGVSAESRQPMA